MFMTFNVTLALSVQVSDFHFISSAYVGKFSTFPKN